MTNALAQDRLSVSRDPKKTTAVRLLVTLSVFLCGANIEIVPGVTTTFIVVLLLLPVWLPAAVRRRDGRIWFTFVLLCLFSALALLVVNSGTGGVAEISSFNTGNSSALMRFFLTYSCIFGILAWALDYLKLTVLAGWFAAGLIVQAIANYPALAENFWKYGISQALTILVLLLLPSRRRGVAVVILALLALVGVATESRSYSAFCVVAAIFFLYARSFGSRQRSFRSTAVSVGFVLLAGAAIYQLGTVALLDGYLGDGAQTKTQQQIAQTGSILAGARPEWSATIALMQYRPLGFGPGAVPSPNDLAIGQAGLQKIGISGRSEYYLGYVFGGQFKLHSTVADLWSSFGIPGLLMGSACFVVVLLALVREISRADANVAWIFVFMAGAWFLMFGPIYSNYIQIVLATFIAAVRLKEAAPVGPQRTRARQKHRGAANR